MLLSSAHRNYKDVQTHELRVMGGGGGGREITFLTVRVMKSKPLKVHLKGDIKAAL